jgi:hypothetical protein
MPDVLDWSPPIATGWPATRGIKNSPAVSPALEMNKIDVAAAKPACDDARNRYPSVARFSFEAGRVAAARIKAALDFYQIAARAGKTAHSADFFPLVPQR